MTRDLFLESHEARNQARVTLKQLIEQAAAATPLMNADRAAVSMGLEYAVDAHVLEVANLTASNLAYVVCVRDLRRSDIIEQIARQVAEINDTGPWHKVRSARFSVAYRALRDHLSA